MDTNTDTLIGPHSQANTVMVRNLKKTFKLPVYNLFDRAISRKILFKIINQLEMIGFKVLLTVCDMGPR